MYKSEYSFTWKIENFSFCQQSNGQGFGTGKFYPTSFGGLRGYFQLYPRGKQEEYSNFISCSLFVNTVDHIDFLKCEVKAIGASGKILKVHKWNDFSNQIVTTMLECPDFLAIKDVAHDAEDCAEDTLTICGKLYGTNSKQNLSDRDFEHTKIGVDRHTFYLQIERGKTAKHLITFGSNRNIEFSITETLGNLKILISKLDSEDEKAWFADCTFTLDKQYESKTYSERVKRYFPSARLSDFEFPSAILSSEWKSYLSFSKTIRYHPSHISLHCEFSCSNGIDFTFSTPGNESPYISNKADVFLTSTITIATIHPTLQEDLLTLFHSKKLSDLKLRVGDQTIGVHKNVLVARSPVFAVMFDHQDMTETSSGIVDITDIDAQTLKLFLQFLYTDTVDDMDYEVAMDLMMAAEKYQVLALKEKCSMFLRNEMSVGNVCEILSLADAVNHENLKSISIEFIIANSATILSSPEWITWMKNNMESATAIFSKLTLNHSSSKN